VHHHRSAQLGVQSRAPCQPRQQQAGPPRGTLCGRPLPQQARTQRRLLPHEVWPKEKPGPPDCLLPRQGLPEACMQRLALSEPLVLDLDQSRNTGSLCQNFWQNQTQNSELTGTTFPLSLTECIDSIQTPSRHFYPTRLHVFSGPGGLFVCGCRESGCRKELSA
jgi:hypothetical protein